MQAGFAKRTFGWMTAVTLDLLKGQREILIAEVGPIAVPWKV